MPPRRNPREAILNITALNSFRGWAPFLIPSHRHLSRDGERRAVYGRTNDLNLSVGNVQEQFTASGIAEPGKALGTVTELPASNYSVPCKHYRRAWKSRWHLVYYAARSKFFLWVETLAAPSIKVTYVSTMTLVEMSQLGLTIYRPPVLRGCH